MTTVKSPSIAEMQRMPPGIHLLGASLPVPYLGMAPHHFLDLIRLLRPVLGEMEVWVHGSRVHGGYWRMSDIDLVLRHRSEPETQHGEVIRSLRARLSQSNLPYITDVHEWAGLPDWLKEQVLQGVRLELPAPISAEVSRPNDLELHPL
jgi:hypothetical protein